MRRARYLVVLTLAGAPLACSLVTSLEGFTGGANLPPNDSGSDASLEATTADAAREAAPDTGVRDAGDEAGVNLYPKGGTFETGSCDPFVGFQGSVATTSTARSGAAGCRVCTLPSTTDFFTADDSLAFGLAQKGERYRARLWVRTEAGKPATSQLELNLRAVVFDPGYNAVGFASSPSIAVDATWRQLEVAYTFDRVANLNVFVSARHAPGACFVIDDVTLERLP